MHKTMKEYFIYEFKRGLQVGYYPKGLFKELENHLDELYEKIQCLENRIKDYEDDDYYWCPSEDDLPF